MARRLFADKRLPFILIAACLLYLSYLPRYYFGFFNDDALFTIGAKSLLTGQFVNLSDPFLPPMSRLGIGYPLFLAPFVALLGSHFPWLKLTSILLSLGTLCLFSIFLERRGPEKRILWGVGLLAFNSTFALSSGTVMSDVLFQTLVLSSLVLLDFAFKDEKAYGIWLGLAMTWAWWTRPMGALLFVSVLAAILWGKRKTLLWLAAPWPLLGWLLMSLRNIAQAGEANQYHSYWLGFLPSLAEGGRLFDNTIRVFYTFFVYGLCGIVLPRNSTGIWICIGISGLLMVFASYGIVQALKKRNIDAPVSFAAALFTFSYLCVHCLWTALARRYLLPILPFLLFFSGLGLSAFMKRSVACRQIGIGLLVIFLSANVYRHIAELTVAWSPDKSAEETFPKETLSWIRLNTPPNARVIGKSPLIYLATGRQGVMMVNFTSPQEYQQAVTTLGLTHVLVQPARLLDVAGDRTHNTEAVWRMNFELPERWPSFFKRVYSNPNEHTVLYAITPTPRTSRAATDGPEKTIRAR